MLSPRIIFQNNITRTLSSFVPKHSPLAEQDKNNFIEFLNNYNNILVLTGAGVSTESGIPDYRSEDVGLYSKPTYKPIQYSTFLKSPEARMRYWARNFAGWPRFSRMAPNTTHHAITTLELCGKLSGIITQNVDSLHFKAGGYNIIELHGTAYWVECLQCKAKVSRYDFQKTLEELNPNLKINSSIVRPDGDVELDDEIFKNFVVPNCEHCGGMLKPCIVFFGDNVPQARVKKIEALVESSEALLIVGTSLSTQSSLRIVEQAYDLCKFICLVNIGPTRGDKLVDLKINAKCSEVFGTVKHRKLLENFELQK